MHFLRTLPGIYYAQISNLTFYNTASSRTFHRVWRLLDLLHFSPLPSKCLRQGETQPMIVQLTMAKNLTKRKHFGFSQKIKAQSSSCAEYLLFSPPQLLLSGWKKKFPKGYR